MKLKRFILVTAIALASFNALAREWSSSVGISVSTSNGFVSFGLSNGCSFVQGACVRPGVVYVPPPVICSPPPVYVVPCYNCGQYPVEYSCDPYRNHRHLQRPYYPY